VRRLVLTFSPSLELWGWHGQLEFKTIISTLKLNIFKGVLMNEWKCNASQLHTWVSDAISNAFIHIHILYFWYRRI